jgi:hypothetical protein
MKEHHSAFKDTQVFGWESEPKDERPSEVVHSTGFSALSGYYAMPDSRGAASRRPKHHGFNLVLLAGAAIVGLGVVALYGMVHLLRG